MWKALSVPDSSGRWQRDGTVRFGAVLVSAKKKTYRLFTHLWDKHTITPLEHTFDE